MEEKLGGSFILVILMTMNHRDMFPGALPRPAPLHSPMHSPVFQFSGSWPSVGPQVAWWEALCTHGGFY